MFKFTSSHLHVIRVDEIKCIFAVLSKGKATSSEFGPNPEYSLCKCLGLKVWRRGGGGMLLNYRWSEVRLLNLYIPLIIDF